MAKQKILIDTKIKAKIKVLGVLPAHLFMVLDVGTDLVSVPTLICAGFVFCHCIGRWAL